MFIVLSLTGCSLNSMTDDLWEKPSYSEKVEGYYIALDEDMLIVDGNKFEYIFDISPELRNILLVRESLMRDNFRFGIDYKNFEIDTDNVVTGDIMLYLKTKYGTEKAYDSGYDSSEKAKLLELGFTSELVYETQLLGKLYRIDEQYLVKVDKQYLVKEKFHHSALFGQRFFFVEKSRGASSQF